MKLKSAHLFIPIFIAAVMALVGSMFIRTGFGQIIWLIALVVFVVSFVLYFVLRHREAKAVKDEKNKF